MKSLLTIFLLSIAAFANAQDAQFCIKNDTHSNNYQFRVEYTCPDDGKNTTHWTEWKKIDEGPNIGTCALADDFTCKGWVAITLEVRTGNSNNSATLSAPNGTNISKMTLVDPLNDNAVGTISWDTDKVVRIF